MKKVIFLTIESYNLPSARVRCYNFAAALERKGIPSEVISYFDHLHARYDRNQIYRCSDTERMLLNIKAFFRLCREQEYIIYLQKVDYQFVIAYLLNYLIGLPFILDYDDYDFNQEPFTSLCRIPCLRSRYLTFLLAEKSLAIVAASKYIQRIFSTLSRAEKVYYIPTGVDTNIFKIRESPLRKDDRVVFSWAGMIWGVKILNDLMFLIDCFSRARNVSGAKLEIAGGGPLYETHLMKLLESHPMKSNIMFVGWIGPREIPQYFTQIDVGLVVLSKTSHSMSKSPTKMFEYMAMGKPVIAPAFGEPASIIRNGENGFLYSSGEDLTSHIEHLIENRNAIVDAGKRAFRTIQEGYSLDVLGDRLYSVIHSLLGDEKD